MAEPTELNSIIQEVLDARVDMQSFEEFMNAAKEVIVARRLAGGVNTLDYYLDYLNAIKLVFTQASGDVTVGDKTVKSISQLMLEAARTLEKTGGNIPYPTYAAMVADKANITNKMILEVTNDTDPSKNGKYTYDGVSVFKKSAYDPEATIKSKVINAFPTKALMTASPLADGAYAQVNDDTVATNNGLYVKAAGLWVKSKYDVQSVIEPLLADIERDNLSYFKTTAGLLNSELGNPGQWAYSQEDGGLYAYTDFKVARLAETTSLLARFTNSPTARDIEVMNRLIHDLKVGGVWQKLDGLWIARTTRFDNSKLNWVADKHNLQDGTGYIDWDKRTSSWNFAFRKFNTDLNIANTVGTKLTQNAISFGAYMDISKESKNFLGAYSSANGGLSLSYELSTRDLGFRVNQKDRVVHKLPSLVENKATTLIVTRSGNEVSSYVGGKLLNSSNSPSTPPVAETFKVGYLAAGVGSDAPGCLAAFVGNALTPEENMVLTNALRDYLVRFGKDTLKTYDWTYVGLLNPNDKLSALSDYIFDGEEALTTSGTLTGVIDETIINQEYMGGYIEIQPDSWTGTHNTATDATTETWGFPQSLTNIEQSRLRKDLFRGDGKGLQYIRFPLGYAYRGYRNIDEVSGLARNIGERYLGQNAALRKLFADISKAGGGLAPEYWCPPVHWLTSGSYHGDNRITAGGSYSRGTLLSSIRTTDPVQYAAQIDAFTDAIVDDYEYLHTNIAPVRMYGLSNEPEYGQMMYGACSFDAETYSDIILALHPKVQSSAILSEWNGEPNKVLLHVASDDHAPYWSRAAKLEAQHPEYIWGYTHHMIGSINGEHQVPNSEFAADYYRSTSFANALGGRKNVFLNEYEYFQPNKRTPAWMCSNNMLAYINSVIYSDSRLIMPIIHVCKQLGATSSQTNTIGYALTQVNLQEGYGLAPNNIGNTANAGYGTYAPIKHNYNAWKFIAENLPIGAIRIGGLPTNTLLRVNYVTYKFEGKLYLFIVNALETPTKVTLTFDKTRKYNGRVYNSEVCGKVLTPKSGKTIVFELPAQSGQAWVEV